MKVAILSAVASTALFAAAPAVAQTLNFAGLNGAAKEHVGDYYAGGTGNLGSAGGTNYGVTFSANAYACSPQPGGGCDTAGLPSGGNALFSSSGSAILMNVAGGFGTGLAFAYSAIRAPATVTVFSGLNGTGTELAAFPLMQTFSIPGASGCNGAGFCPYWAFGGGFSGVARSVAFSAGAGELALANITLNQSSMTISSGTGSGSPAPVPEPAAWAMLIVGAGLAGGSMRFRRSALRYA